MRLGEAGPAEARPAVAAGFRVQRARLGRVVAGRFEQDHVVDDAGPLRLDDGARDVHVLGQMWLEQEAVVVVQTADRRLWEIRLRGCERHGRSGGVAAGADRCDRTAFADARAAADPACDQILLGRRQDPLRLPDVGGRVGAGHPRRHLSLLGHPEDCGPMCCGGLRAPDRKGRDAAHGVTPGALLGEDRRDVVPGRGGCDSERMAVTRARADRSEQRNRGCSGERQSEAPLHDRNASARSTRAKAEMRL